MAVDLDSVGRRTEAFEKRWTSTDALLYAVGVGAGLGQPYTELEYSTENSDGHPQRVLPTYAAVLAGVLPPVGDIDFANFFHAGQRVDVFADLPVDGHVRTWSEVTGIHDKRSGALVTTRAPIVDVASGTTLAVCTSSYFLRGEGGFGQSLGEPAEDAWERPDRAPDHVERMVTRPEQALIYRLTGDRNRLHSDPVLAAEAGFDRPILHGMCTYGFTGRALLKVLDGEPLGYVGGRFSRPVFPGDELVVSTWRTDDGLLFETATADGTVVLANGVAGTTPDKRLAA